MALALELDVRVGDLVDGDLHARHLLPGQLKLFGHHLCLDHVPLQVPHPRLGHLLLLADRGKVQLEVPDVANGRVNRTANPNLDSPRE